MPGDAEVNWGKFVGLGLELAAGVGLGAAVGYWLDERYAWSPWGVLVGCAVGLAGGMYLLVKQALRANRD